MIEHLTSSSWFTATWVFLISAWGGIAGYIKKISEGKARDFSIKELIGEIVISSFVGVITYFLCVSAGIDETLTAAIVGMSGHMGSRAIYFIELFIKEKTGMDMHESETRKKNERTGDNHDK
jgi:hypothetical protein